jgi:hemolysin activation/secretion protein
MMPKPFRALLALVLPAAPLAAQQVPSPAEILQRTPGANPDRINEAQRRQLEDRARTQAAPPSRSALEVPAEAPEGAAPGADIRFTLSRVDFDDSAYLARADLAALTAPLIGKEVSLAELRDVVGQVNALYKARGIATARAVLPTQDIVGGIVRVRLVEGRVGTVSITGASPRSAAGVRDQLAIRGGTLADPAGLEHDLRVFGLNNDDQLRAQLAPGEGYGTTDLVLTVQQPRRVSVDLFTDNSGYSSTGIFQQGAVARLYRLLAYGDRLTGAFVHSRGVRSGNVDYAVPVGRMLRMSVNGAYGTTRVRNGALAQLDIRGTSKSVGGNLSALLFVGPRLVVTGTGGIQQTNSLTRITGQRAIDNRAFAATLGLSATYAAPGVYLLMQQQAAYSPVDERVSGTIIRPVLFRGSAVAAASLAPALQLQVRGDWQVSSRGNLPGILQYQVGGPHSNRGFAPGTAAGDRGLSATGELSYTRAIGPWTLQPLVFADHAQASGPGVRASLDSLGAGVGLSLGGSFSVRATYARAVHRRDTPANDDRAYLTAFVHI